MAGTVILVMMLMKMTATEMKTTSLDRTNPQTTRIVLTTAIRVLFQLLCSIAAHPRMPLLVNLLQLLHLPQSRNHPLLVERLKFLNQHITGRSVLSSLQIAHFWALLKTLISKMFRPWNFSPNSSQMRWLQWSWNRLICIPVKSPERLSM